jgi:hypothetical protein
MGGMPAEPRASCPRSAVARIAGAKEIRTLLNGFVAGVEVLTTRVDDLPAAAVKTELNLPARRDHADAAEDLLLAADSTV